MNSSIATHSAMYRNPVSVCITLDCGYPSICTIEYMGIGAHASTSVLCPLFSTMYPSVCRIDYIGIGAHVATSVLCPLFSTMYPSTHDCIVLNVFPRLWNLRSD